MSPVETPSKPYLANCSTAVCNSLSRDCVGAFAASLLRLLGLGEDLRGADCRDFVLATDFTCNLSRAPTRFVNLK